MTHPSFCKDDSAASRAEWQRIVFEQCNKSPFCIADRLCDRTSAHLPKHLDPRRERIITQALAQRAVDLVKVRRDEEDMFNQLTAEMPQIVAKCERVEFGGDFADEVSQGVDEIDQKELDKDFGSFELSDDVAADLEFVRNERKRTKGFRDRELLGDYVAVYQQQVVGSGRSETQLRNELAAKHHVDPKRFVIEYIGRGY